MRLSPRISIIGGSILGSFVIHAVLVACSGQQSMDTLKDAAGSRDAHAGESPTCRAWEVQTYYPSSIGWKEITAKDIDGKEYKLQVPVVNTFTLPVDWEPIGAGGSGFGVLGRHCISP